MGSSIQQIVVGIICVGAAFTFGTYINQNPSLGTPQENFAEKPTELSLTTKKLEKMPVLSSRVTSLRSLDQPATRANSPQVSEAPKLPSPSDLDPRLDLKGKSQPQIRTASPSQVASSQQQEITPPDFSGLVLDQNLAESTNSQEQIDPESSRTTSTMPTVETTSNSIRNIADSFRAQANQPLAPPEFQPGTPEDKFPTASPSPGTDTDFDDTKSVRLETSERSAVVSKPVLANREQPVEFMQDDSDLKVVSMAPMPKGKPEIQTTDSLPPLPATEKVSDSIAEHEFDRSDQSSLTMNSVLDPSKPWRTKSSTLSQDISPQQWQPQDKRTEATEMASREVHHPTSTQKVNRLPFGLTYQAKAQLVRFNHEASRKIKLETTKFAEHVVLNGETLQSISTRYLGKPDFYLDIYLANRDRLANPVHVSPGMVLKIPLYEN